MEVAGQVRAIRNKRRRLQPNSSALHQLLPNHCCCLSASPFQFPHQQTSLCFHNQSITTISISSDLKADENSGTDEISKSTSDDAFSTDEKTEQVVESITKKKRKISQARSVDASKMPSAEEIEDFFSVAEMLEKKRFSEKYNYDIVKDVALEGRYQWVRVKPC